MKRARVYYKCIDARRAFCIRRYARRRLLCVCMYASARDKYGFPARSPRDNDICYSISSARDGGSLAGTDNFFVFRLCVMHYYQSAVYRTDRVCFVCSQKPLRKNWTSNEKPDNNSPPNRISNRANTRTETSNRPFQVCKQNNMTKTRYQNKNI